MMSSDEINYLNRDFIIFGENNTLSHMVKTLLHYPLGQVYHEAAPSNIFNIMPGAATFPIS